MKKIITGKAALLALVVVFSISCKKNDKPMPPPGPGTITSIVSSDPTLSILKSAVVKADLATTLDGTGPFTVFAPTNDAFAASGLSADAVNGLPGATLKTILEYHTITAKIMAADVPAGPNAKVTTASGDSVFVTKNAKGVFINGVDVTKADIAASNGVIHEISHVLLPPAGNIVEVAAKDTTFSLLVAAVVRASTGSTNVANLLSGAGGILTVFAPTNNAFRAIGLSSADDINKMDPNTLTSILAYHLVPGRVFSSDLSDGATPKTVQGSNVTIGISGSGATVKGTANATASKIIGVNVMATNGVVHVIDQVLLPGPGSIAAIVSSDPDLTLLKSAVVKAGLAATLDGPGPFTVFAPTDAAFAASGIDASVINSLTGPQLSPILLYHAIPAKILAADVPAGPNAKVTTAGGDSVFVTKNANGVFINGIDVTKADIAASNGVIHEISHVLMPPAGNIVQVASGDTSFSLLVAAVVRASTGATNVAALLSSGGIFTVFAPTNNAFRAIGLPTADAINALDPDALTAILAYHVLGGRIFSSDLTNGATPATLAGPTVTIGLGGGGASVKGNANSTPSNITAANIMATNGVIHVIDQVLLH